VIFVIRTRVHTFSNSPHRLLATMSLAAVAITAILPFMPFGDWFSLVALPGALFAALAAMVVGYLTLFEFSRRLFHRWAAPLGAGSSGDLEGRLLIRINVTTW